MTAVHSVIHLIVICQIWTRVYIVPRNKMLYPVYATINIPILVIIIIYGVGRKNITTACTPQW